MINTMPNSKSQRGPNFNSIFIVPGTFGIGLIMWLAKEQLSDIKAEQHDMRKTQQEMVQTLMPRQEIETRLKDIDSRMMECDLETKKLSARMDSIEIDLQKLRP